MPLSQSIAQNHNKCVSLNISTRQGSTYQLLGVQILTCDLGSCFITNQTFASTEMQSGPSIPILEANGSPILFKHH
uniref:Uncharacterized protein n=1 Tax=Arundo donax TaxID=35708 RepID=A0A0A9FV54_ARUDO